MYDLPINPNAKDIITRSVVCHPSAFRDALVAQANMHADYEELSRNPLAKRGAAAQKNACLRAYDWLGRDDLPEGERAACIAGELNTMIIALNVACKLQCLPPHVRTAAAIA